MEKELVITVPTQIKDNLNIGNIYEFILADFYTKIKKMQGKDVEFGVIWNTNGKLIEEAIIEKNGIFLREEAQALVFDMIKSSNRTMNRFFIEPDFQIRDDMIQKELESCINNKYVSIIENELADISICSRCGAEFGSDISVTTCKYCGAEVRTIKKNTLFIMAERTALIEKIEKTSFYPDGCRKRLSELINKLPSEYKIILEKNRKYTLSYEDYKLDPRFVTIFTLPIIKKQRKKKYDIVTVFQGDVVKKYDYYAFAYLEKDDCPTNIFMHGLVTDNKKKKLRWRSEDLSANEKVFPGVKSKEFRAFLLKHNIVGNIMLDENTLEKEVKEQVNLFITMKRLLEDRNLDSSLRGIREELKGFYDEFILNANKMRLYEAYKCMYSYIFTCWKLVKDSKLSLDEQQLVTEYMTLYYGKSCNANSEH